MSIEICTPISNYSGFNDRNILLQFSPERKLQSKKLYEWTCHFLKHYVETIITINVGNL